ncbi:MAG: hypothetical protein KBH01_00430 [Breznakibacter sp.]|nr:hypothetical protein [Breznakibacter sp.]
MKKRLFLVAFSALMILGWQCRSTQGGGEGLTAEVVATDSLEYELLVMDSGYDRFLLTEAQPKNFYSNDYYRSWNIRYVAEWNMRCNNPRQYGSFYVTPIDYSPHVDYGLELNYRLYNYFLFIERQYRIVLIPRGRLR